VGKNGVEPLRRAVEAAEIAGTPLMCHIAEGIALKDVLDLLRSGDIITHCFQGKGVHGENVTDPAGKLLPEVIDARQKGVVMDVGHGGGSFRWEIAEAALAEGFLPDVISTDLHAYNLYGPLYDMATTLTKFLYLGVPLEDVVTAATAAPARSIGRPDLGTLALGAPADLAIFRIADEPVELWDTHVQRRTWDRRLRVEATVREGVVYRPEELAVESEEEITRRCRKRGPDAMRFSWKRMRADAAEGGRSTA
jgi:dihydroorotase